MTEYKIKEKLKNIIIIDDDDISNFIYKKIIHTTGLVENVITFHKAKEALNYLKETIESTPDLFPELIFLDINMPVMSGWQFLENYRPIYNHQPGGTVLCVLSSSVYQEDIDRAQGYKEVNEYISKPLTASIIDNIYQKYFK